MKNGLTLDALRETMRKIGAGPTRKPRKPYLYAPRGSWLYKELQKRFGAEHVIQTDPIPPDVVTNLSQKPRPKGKPKEKKGRARIQIPPPQPIFLSPEHHENPANKGHTQ